MSYTAQSVGEFLGWVKASGVRDDKVATSLAAYQPQLDVKTIDALAGRMEQVTAFAAAPSTQNAGWQPIDTAPKDGRPLLLFLFNPKDYKPNLGNGLVWISSGGVGQATLWMPVAPPSQNAELGNQKEES